MLRVKNRLEMLKTTTPFYRCICFLFLLFFFLQMYEKIFTDEEKSTLYRIYILS